MLEVRASHGAGRGLFATEAIPADELLLTSPIVLIAGEQRAALQQTVLDEYVYEWDDDGTAALVLGMSSMCNHAADPNAQLWLVTDRLVGELWSTRPIARGEEVTVSYRMPGDDTPLWFEERGAE